MANLTITEAIKRSPIGKTQFYKKYIDTGKITVSVDNMGKKFIDSSELLRVFGEIREVDLANVREQSSEDDSRLKVNDSEQLRMEVKLLREALEKAEQDKQWLKDQNTTLLLRLEAPKTTNPIVRWWNGLK